MKEKYQLDGSILTDFGRCETEAEERAWMEQKHPSVKEALANGQATIICLEHGYLWCGSESAYVRWYWPRFLSWYKPDADVAEAGEWPRLFTFNGWFLRLVSVEENPQYALYRRDLGAENHANH